MVSALIFWSHVCWISTRKMSLFFFFPSLQSCSKHLLKPSSIREELSQSFFEKDCEDGLWIYDFKMWEAFSGGWNTIHLLWSLNQTDHRFPMIHDASMLKRNAFYHSVFLSVHMLYTTSATVNSNMMRFLHNAQHISCEFLCQPPPLIMVTNFFFFFFLYGLYFTYWHIIKSTCCVFFLCFNMSMPICSVFYSCRFLPNTVQDCRIFICMFSLFLRKAIWPYTFG